MSPDGRPFRQKRVAEVSEQALDLDAIKAHAIAALVEPVNAGITATLESHRRCRAAVANVQRLCDEVERLCGVLEQWRGIGRQRVERTIVEYRMPGDHSNRIGCYSCGAWGYRDTGLVHRVSCDVGQMQKLLEKVQK